MRRLFKGLTAAVLVALVSVAAVAQAQDEEREGERRQDRRPRAGRDRDADPGPRSDRGARFPGIPLLAALDADGNRELSAEEIENAAGALKKLDKDGDGKLTRSEILPEGFRRGGPGFAGPGDRADAGPRGDFAQRVMRFDENNDGKVTKEEAPERMRVLLFGIDANSDGAIDKQELAQMAERFPRQGFRGAREQRNRPPRADRRQRPDAEESDPPQP